MKNPTPCQQTLALAERNRAAMASASHRMQAMVDGSNARIARTYRAHLDAGGEMHEVTLAEFMRRV